MAVQPLDVEAAAHFLAGLEIGDPLRTDIDGLAGAGVTAGACIAGAGGESAETAQFDAAIGNQARGDFFEESIDDAFDLTRRQVGIVRRKDCTSCTSSGVVAKAAALAFTRHFQIGMECN